MENKTGKKRHRVPLTSPYTEFMKTAEVLNEKKYVNDEKRLKKEMVAVENEIRREESRSFQEFANMGPIDGITLSK